MLQDVLGDNIKYHIAYQIHSDLNVYQVVLKI